VIAREEIIRDRGRKATKVSVDTSRDPDEVIQLARKYRVSVRVCSEALDELFNNGIVAVSWRLGRFAFEYAINLRDDKYRS